VQLNVATLAAGQKAAGTATLQPIPGSLNKELVLNLQIPEGAQGKRGVGIADVDLKVTFVEHGKTVQNTASLTDIPGKEDKRLVLSLQIPMPPPATVDFTTADKRYVQKAGDIMTGRLAVDSYLFSKWFVVGASSTSLGGSWGIVQEGGGTSGDSGTLRIGVFVNEGEASSGKLHVPVLSMTSVSLTTASLVQVSFPGGLTVGRKEAPMPDALVVYGDTKLNGKLTVSGGVSVSGGLTVEGDLKVTGTKFFVHAHPTDPTLVIAYASLEGPEAGTYIRGTAQLSGGVAVIELPEYFALVTSEEGLTAQVTPLEECNGLYVAEKSPQRIVVKELMGGKSNARFDYLVQGVRKGYEDFVPVRPGGE
jgi:hypothetical protein